jgi:hypothetical protein
MKVSEISGTNHIASLLEQVLESYMIIDMTNYSSLNFNKETSLQEINVERFYQNYLSANIKIT